MFVDQHPSLPAVLVAVPARCDFGSPEAEESGCIPRPQGPKGYSRVTLRRDAEAEIAAVRWLPGAASRLHGHGSSAAVYTVLSGVVEEERYLPEGDGFRYEVAVLRAGQLTRLPPGGFHRVRALAESVTAHVYTPPPTDPTAGVPPDVLPLLEQARQQEASTPRPVPGLAAG
jgi:hypothetical protein